MLPHEKMVARWLTEEWDRESSNYVRWVKDLVRRKYPYNTLENPSKVARLICIRLLEKHKNELSLKK